MVPIINAKQIQRKSRNLTVRQIRPSWFKVSSGKGGKVYDVMLGLNGGTCTCPWGQYRPSRDHRSSCAHVIAAMNYRAMLQGKRVSVWSSKEAARRQHRPMIMIGDGLFLTSRSH